MLHCRPVLSFVLLLCMLIPLPVLAQDDEQGYETYASESTGFTFEYPSEWVINDGRLRGIIVMGSSDEVVDTIFDGGVPPAGESGIWLLNPELAKYFIGGEVEDATTAQDALEILYAFFVDEDDFVAEEVTLGEHTAYQVMAEQDGATVQLTTIEVDGAYLIALSFVGEGDDFEVQEDTFFHVLDSLSYRAPTGTVSFESQAENLTFEFPAEWYVVEQDDESIVVTNNLSTLSGDFPDDAAMLRIIPPNTLEDFDLDSETLPADAATDLFGVSDEYLSEAAEITVGDYTGAQVLLDNGLIQGYTMALDVDGSMFLIMGITNSGEFDAHDETMTGIIETIEYTP